MSVVFYIFTVTISIPLKMLTIVWFISVNILFCMTWGQKKTFLVFIVHRLTYSLLSNPRWTPFYIFTNDVILNAKQIKACYNILWLNTVSNALQPYQPYYVVYFLVFHYSRTTRLYIVWIDTFWNDLRRE